MRSESEVTQSCLTLWDPVDCSLRGSSIHGIFQSRVLEWVAISFSRGSSQPRDWTWVSSNARRWFYHLSHLKHIHIHGSGWIWVDGGKGWEYYLAGGQRLFDDCHPGSNEVIYYFSFHFHFSKSNQCWASFPFKDLNVRTEIIKLLKGNIGGTPWHKLYMEFFSLSFHMVKGVRWIRKLWYITKWNIIQLNKGTHLSQF